MQIAPWRGFWRRDSGLIAWSTDVVKKLWYADARFCILSHLDDLTTMQTMTATDDVHCWAVENSRLSLSFDEALSRLIRCLCDARGTIGRLDQGGRLGLEVGGRTSLGVSC